MLALSFGASAAAFQAPHLLPAHPAAVRFSADVEMFTGGARGAPPKKVVKKAPVKKAGKAAPAKSQGLFSSGTATAKAPKTKRAVSTPRQSQTYIDVTGAAYEEASLFVPQYDEVGVLPPLGRWDPLQIREQGPERYRRFVEMEIKHGRLAMAGFLGVLTTYSGMRWPGYLSKAEGIKFEDLPGGAPDGRVVPDRPLRLHLRDALAEAGSGEGPG